MFYACFISYIFNSRKKQESRSQLEKIRPIKPETTKTKKPETAKTKTPETTKTKTPETAKTKTPETKDDLLQNELSALVQETLGRERFVSQALGNSEDFGTRVHDGDLDAFLEPGYRGL